jgi:Uma2 family endonuclease
MSVEAPPELAPPEVIPDLSKYKTEDNAPVDSFFHAYQQVLLVEQLTSSWPGPADGRPYMITKNVGLFHTARQPAVVPDVMLSLDVEFGRDQSLPENRSYFLWVVGKPPDVVIEIISPTHGGELTDKMQLYARIGIPYYAVFDPEHHQIPEDIRLYAREGRTYHLAPDAMAQLIAEVGLGLTVWNGAYIGVERGPWLRWTDANGVLIPTGQERGDAEARRAETEARRAEAAEAQTRQLEEKLARYTAKLRDAGLSPNGD